MPRMSKRDKLEWSFFIGENGRRNTISAVLNVSAAASRAFGQRSYNARARYGSRAAGIRQHGSSGSERASALP